MPSRFDFVREWTQGERRIVSDRFLCFSKYNERAGDADVWR